MRSAVGNGVDVVSLNAPAQHTATVNGLVRDLAPALVLFSHLGMPGRQQCIGTPAEVLERLAALLQLAAEDHVGVEVSGHYAARSLPHASPHAAA